MKLNRVSLNVVGLNRIGLNRIGSPSRRGSSGTDRPYIDPEVLTSLKAVCICYGKSNDDPDRAVVKNLVDPDNPFVISNAAYKGMSGYNGYPNSFNDYTVVSGVTKTESSIKIEKELTGSGWFLYIPANTPVASMKLKIDGIPSNRVIKWNTNVEGIGDITLTNGVNEIPAYTSSAVSGIYTVYSNLKDFTITQIPQFEGAFVTDGIDDLITSTKSVTEMLDGSNEVTVVSMIHQIKTNDDTTRNNWLFTPVSYLENRIVKDKTGKTGVYGYTSTNVTGAQISDITPILGDKNDYTLYSKIEHGDIDYFSVEGFQNEGIWYTSSVAWYWTIIANKVLTTDQINQVIAYFNLDRTLKPDILCNTIKQGITNENHAEFGDKLIDFSGNGRDIQLNNIAWKGDSGIGKYEVDFSTWSGSGIVIGNGVGFKIERETTRWWGMSAYGDTSGLGSFTIKVTNCHDLFVYRYKDEDGNWKDYPIESDGIYTLPASGAKDDEDNYRFFNSNPNATYNGLTVEQIPSHAGALCLDGVDDFGQFVGNLGLKDYTFIVDRAYDRIALEQVPFIASKSTNGQAPFLMEYLNSDNYVYPHSFGATTKTTNLNIQRQISYQSTYVYNGNSISKGISIDTGDGLTIGNSGSTGAQYSPLCLWSLMLFPYSMSEFLIERQLKKHKLGTLYPDMVEFRPIVKSNLPYSSISYSVNPGEYISVDSMVTITVTLPNTSDKLMEVSCNAISDISISGDNGVYEITGKIVKSPQKINITIYQPPEYLTMLSNSTLISNETLIKNE